MKKICGLEKFHYLCAALRQGCVETLLQDQKLFASLQANIGKFASTHANELILAEVEQLLAGREGRA